MTLIYVCGYKIEDFLADVDADQLFRLLCRDIQVCVKYKCRNRELTLKCKFKCYEKPGQRDLQ